MGSVPAVACLSPRGTRQTAAGTSQADLRAPSFPKGFVLYMYYAIEGGGHDIR